LIEASWLMNRKCKGRWPPARKRDFLRLLAGPVLGGIALPVCALNGICSFQAKGISINFGNLDPSNAVNVAVLSTAATLNADRAGNCTVAMTITAGNGLHFAGGTRRMAKAGNTDFVNYTFLNVPLAVAGPGNGQFRLFQIRGGILGADYANASAGTYTDTVTVTVNP
jgi:spore coat protein U-like protein